MHDKQRLPRSSRPDRGGMRDTPRKNGVQYVKTVDKKDNIRPRAVSGLPLGNELQTPRSGETEWELRQGRAGGGHGAHQTLSARSISVMLHRRRGSRWLTRRGVQKLTFQVIARLPLRRETILGHSTCPGPYEKVECLPGHKRHSTVSEVLHGRQLMY